MVAQLASDLPTRALLERREREAAGLRAASDSSTVESATVPLPRRPRVLRTSPPATPSVLDDTLPFASRVPASDPTSDLAPIPQPRPLVSTAPRWRQVLLFGSGVVIGGTAAILIILRFAPVGGSTGVRPEVRFTKSGGTVATAGARRSRQLASAPPTDEKPTPSIQRRLARRTPGAPPELSLASRRDDPPPRTVEQAGADRFHEDWSAAGATTGDNGAVAYPIDAASPTPFTPVPFDKGDPPLPARGDWREAWTDVEMAMQTGAKWEALTPRRTLEAERAVSLAAALVQVGDVSTALTLLEQASTTDARLATLLRDPLLAPLLTNARFRRVRRQSSE